MPSRRNYWIWYAVTIVTLGIGSVVWYYLINRDAKRLADEKRWSPAVSVVAYTVGGLVVIPLFVSIWRTWSRVRQATHADGMRAGAQFCLSFIPIVNLAYWGYLQSKLNAAIEERTRSLASAPS